jgi:hypothetical protein
MIREYLRTFAKVSVALFCAWHMVAVGLYTIPAESTDRLSRWIADNATPHVTKYMLITSQWQQWNLFAPDPLRRIVFYRIETQNAEGGWAYVGSVNRQTYGGLRHAVRFKLLGQALEENTTRPEIAERAAQVFCDEFKLDPEANIRIWHETTVVPYVHPSPSKAWWDAWKPTFESSLGIETTCQP